ncbi:cupin domain-containing protein [Kocuria sp. LUK]|uniref:cupin domain-containing protein n=1 Tax=Kocuria sp. LUK TaxID=2897828 RepID=UPI001E2C3B8B|nr:cupin domain-containing protein [Kocuria sp. LUK]MCD1144930.1 cupin domain-containing protein [Kocuria sp. LUK]
MNWTVEQITALREGRETFRDTAQGTALTWVRTGAETDGEYSLMYAEYAPGITVFPHFHTEYTETVHLFEGTLEGRVAGQEVVLTDGEETIVPPGAVHGWHSAGERTLRFVLEVRPAHAGFEKWLVALQRMASDGLTHADGRPKKFSHAALILVESDINLPGPGRALMPVLRLLARRARRTGVARQLEERYWRAP